MQTTANTGLAQVDRITTAAHLTNQRWASPSIVAYDYRIRNFSLCATGGLTYAYDFAVVTNASGDVVRARTLSSGALEIVYATPGSSMTWSSNTVTITSKAGLGVAMNGTGTNNLECYYFHSDGLTVKRITSTDGGHTWAAATTVISTLTSVTGYLTSPAVNIVMIGDSSTGSMVLQVGVYSGSWTVTPWDMGGINTGSLTIWGQSGTYTSPFSAYSLGGNEYILAMYAKAPRSHQNDGIYVEQVSNLVTGQTPNWRQLQSLFATNPGLATVTSTTGVISYPTLYIAFPKIQMVGSEYWITALEVSGYAGHNVQHLCYFRSVDGIHWVSRQYLAGSDLTYTSGVSTVSFTAHDLLNGQVIVSGAYIYLFGFDRVWRTDATMQCGYDNSSKKVDISSYVLPPISIAESGAGQSASVSMTLENPGGMFNNHAILRRGSVIKVSTGYYTSANTDEVMPTVTLLIDEVRQPTKISDNAIENRIQIQARNLIKLLQDDSDKPDIFYSYESPVSTHLSSINDLTAFNTFNGSWMTSGGMAYGGLIDAGSTYVDNFSALAHLKGEDGFMEVQFMATGAWTNSYIGVGFQISDNQDYYAVLFNYANDGKTFGLYKAVPGSAGKIVSYSMVGSLTSQTRTTTLGSALSLNTNYWLRVQQWHNRVMAYYSTDRITWTKVIDYAGNYTVVAGTTYGVQTEISYWGIIQKGNVTASSPFGEQHQPSDSSLDSSRYYLPLNDENPLDLGKAMRYFARVKTGQAGVVRSIMLALSRFETGAALANLPNVTVQIWKDTGDGTKPASLTDPTNKIYETTISPSDVPIQKVNAVTWKPIPVTDSVPILATTYYWISVAAAGDLTYTGSELDATPIALLYMPSSHGGDSQTLKAKFQYNIYDGGFSPTTFYPTSGEFAPSDIINPLFTHPGGAGSTMSAYLTTAYDSSGIEILQINHTGGEFPQITERVAQDICAKAGITGWSPDSWVTDTLTTFNVGGDSTTTAYTWADNQTGTWGIASSKLTGYNASATTWAFVRTNTYWGSRGDGMIEVYPTILAASKRAGILLRASGSPSSFAQSYLVDVSTETIPKISLSKIVSGTVTQLYSTPSLVAVPTNAQFKLSVLSNAGSISVYINECLAGVFWDTVISGQGQVGLAVYGNVSGGAVASFSNFRVPDVWKVKDTFDVAENSSWQSALNNLTGRDRVNYFVRANGTMRLASFSRRESDPTAYDNITVSCTKIDSDRFWASHIRPEGDRFADRFDPTMLSTDWRRFRKEDYTDAYTDEQAYDDAAIPLRNAKEKTVQYEMESACVPALELEDVITLTNPLDGTTAGQFIVNDRTISFDPKDSESTGLVFSQTLGLRSYIP